MTKTVKELPFALSLSFQTFLIQMPLKETPTSLPSKKLPRKTEKVHSTTSGFPLETNLISRDNLASASVSQLSFWFNHKRRNSVS